MIDTTDFPPLNKDAVIALGWSWPLGNLGQHEIFAFARDYVQADRASRAPAQEAKLKAIVKWLEANQPDVFKRGLWEAIAAAPSAQAPMGEPPERITDWFKRLGPPQAAPPAPVADDVRAALVALVALCDRYPSWDEPWIPAWQAARRALSAQPQEGGKS